MIIDRPTNTPAAWSERARTFSDPWQACGWSRSSQTARFAAVLSAIQPKAGERLLDYGCGTGAFADWVPADVGYVGYDTAPGMIARAAKEHPGRSFFGWEPQQAVDITVAVGTFNLPDGWSKEHTWHTLRCLWERTRRVLAVSLYAGDDERCLQYTEAECGPILGESFRSSVERWRRNDLLVVLER